MDNLLEQLEQWNKNDEFSRCIEAIEATTLWPFICVGLWNEGK